MRDFVFPDTLPENLIVNVKNNLTFTINIILNASQIRAQMRTPCESANSKRQINLSFTIKIFRISME